MPAKIILGIDPGSRKTGYGVIQSDGFKYRYIDCGYINVKEVELPLRLQQIFEGIRDIIYQHQPEEAAIEQVFMHHNAGSALKLGQARGAAMVAASTHSLPVSEYSARQVKQAVVGYGAAEKSQVQQMVKTLLSLSAKPQEDAADALAIAICHANSSVGLAALTKTTRIRRGRVR